MKIYKNSLDKETKELAESLLFNGNGFLGIRNIFDEEYYDDYTSNRHTYINGFYDTYEINYPEEYYGCARTGEQLVPVIDGQTTHIYIDGQKFNMNNCNVLEHERYLDLTTGESVRKILFEMDGNQTKLTIKKITSFVKKEQVITKYEFKRINHSSSIELQTHINFIPTNNVDKFDPRVGQHAPKLNIVNVDTTNKEIIFKPNNIDLNCYFKWQTNQNDETQEILDDKIVLKTTLKEDLYIKGYTYNLSEFKSINVNYDEILSEQIDYLANFWEKSKITIKAKDDIEESINYGSFALLQSLGTDEMTSISAKGLSGIGYEGHVFWDAETFVLPFFIKTNPNMARSMLMYRINMLDKAIENRKLVGYPSGALFPWRTITGRECSSFFEAGMAQHHINLDITYSLISYIEYTSDISILEDGGWDLLTSVADMFLSLLHEKEGKYHLDKVTGPDEYTALVDDNYYTNSLLKYTLEYICQYYNKFDFCDLTKEKFEQYIKVYPNIDLPVDSKNNILKQDRDFLNKGKWPLEQMKQPLLLNYHPLFIYRYQICKQADVVLATQLLFDTFEDKDIVRNTVKYYDEITTHDSSLSFSTFATVYAKLGDVKAYEYFLKNARLDLDNLHHNTKDGIHTASMGGTYQTLIDGFANMQITDGKLTFTNNLPEQISYLQFNIVYKGDLYNVVIENKKEPIIIKKEKNEKSSII